MMWNQCCNGNVGLFGTSVAVPCMRGFVSDDVSLWRAPGFILDLVLIAPVSDLLTDRLLVVKGLSTAGTAVGRVVVTCYEQFHESRRKKIFLVCNFVSRCCMMSMC